MLVYLFTDLAACAEHLQAMLTTAVDASFNAISIDGDMSTNDTVLLLASGASGVAATPETAAAFQTALNQVCGSLEWIEAFDDVVAEDWEHGPSCSKRCASARARPASHPGELTTPYRNTIPKHDEVPYPGDRALGAPHRGLIRWNAMAMVHGQNKKDAGIGGHISTYSSLATLLEVGFNHFFHAKYGDQPGDFIYFQGHASPGVYARAYLEGRFDDDRPEELPPRAARHPGAVQLSAPLADAGLLELPHRLDGHRPAERDLPGALHALPGKPRPDREDRPQGLGVRRRRRDRRGRHPGAISLGAREKLDNLIFVVNCNLQRLDGPVRGNKRIIDELEGVFRGAAGTSSR
jgi:pyruvate dehydrogenase E1 component